MCSARSQTAHVVHGELLVEQADERADRARRVVVLGLAEQQRAAAFEIAEIDVVAERRADDPAGAGHGQHHLRLGIVPLGLRVNADLRAGADRGERRTFREDLGVRTDADLEVLRPYALPDQQALQPHRVRRAGADVVQAVADHRQNRRPQPFGLRRVAPRLFLDHPFEQAGHERHAARLDRLKVARSEQPRRALHRECRCNDSPADRRPIRRAAVSRRLRDDGDRVVEVEQCADGRRDRRRES